MPSLKEDEIDMLPYGIEKNRHGLELVVQYAFEQGVIPRKFEVDELFADARQILGDSI
jgi:4,5-dihydroxyphthalate decarboxylase